MQRRAGGRGVTRSNQHADGPQALDPSAAARLDAMLPGRVVLPHAGDYDEARRVWNRAIDRRPAAIVRCAGLDDVRRTIEFARERGTLLALRGGGHSQAGHAVCAGGIVLDLGGLRRVDVDPGARLVRAAAGARVADLLDATGRHGVATPTGGCPDVGLGGLTLGGGENLLMGRYGAVCDSLLAAEVVTADGDVLTASERENADLFWALRGGGGNFGVVTSFDFRAYPVWRVLSGQLYFPLGRTRDVLRRYRDLMRTAPDELQTSGGMMSSHDGATLFIAFCHCGDAAEGQRLLARWTSELAPSNDNVSEKPYAAEFSMPNAPSTGTGAFIPELRDEAIDVLASHYPVAPESSMAVWNDYHGAVTRVPRAETAFPFRQSGFDLFIMAAWDAAAERDRARSWVSGLEKALRPFARGVYVNNLEDEGPERIREAYGPAYERLARVKGRYDPGNLFRMNQNIPPAP